jgi:phage FluMu protein Com
MQIRCYRCNWNFAISRDEIAFVLEALEESGESHYDVRCSRCRHITKLSLEQLRRYAPRSTVKEEEEEEEKQD